ncbi:MAG: MOSC domain-containing protein [Bacteroidetes bacterium]|nr:MOSC domain-containing protein [Bacteroidota bacterium]
MYTVSGLFIYPVKSLGGIALSEATLTDRGFRYDRRWMITDPLGRFITQREWPLMALIKTEITGAGLCLYHKEKPEERLLVPFQPASPQPVAVTVWDDVCEGLYVDPQADEWLSDMLSRRCRLVHMPDSSLRRVDSRYARHGEITSLSDGYPVLIIGQASLDDLNSRLSQPLPMNRFRPNIVFTGGRPFEEDEMSHFRIGDTDFFAVKPCARCVMTTIDQDTAIAAKEPLRTLAGYRNKDNKIYFGQNILYNGHGTVRVGDAIGLVKRGEPIHFTRTFAP